MAPGYRSPFNQPPSPRPSNATDAAFPFLAAVLVCASVLLCLVFSALRASKEQNKTCAAPSSRPGMALDRGPGPNYLALQRAIKDTARGATNIRDMFPRDQGGAGIVAAADDDNDVVRPLLCLPEPCGDPSGEQPSVIEMATRRDGNVQSKGPVSWHGTNTLNTSWGPLLRLVLILLLALGRLLAGRGLLSRALVAGLVHLVKEVQGGDLELIRLLLDLGSGGGVVTRLDLGDVLAQGGDLLPQTVGLSLVELVGVLVKSALGVVQDAVGAVARLDGGLALLVRLGILLRVLDHPLNLVVRQTRSRGNGDGLVHVGGLVLGVDVDNGIGVNVEGDLDLRNATASGGDADKLEVSEQLVVLDELTLTLEDLDLDSGLRVGRSREDLGLLGGDGGVSVDQTGEDTSQSLDTEGEGSNVKEEEILDFTGEDSALDSGAHGDGLVRVDGLGGVTSEDGLDRLGNLGHASHAADQDDLLDVLGLEAGVLEGLANGLDGSVDEGLNHLLELRASELQVDVLGAGSVGGDEGQVDVGLERRGELNLGLLGSLADALDCHTIAGKIEARGLLELGHHVANQVDVEILTTKVGVTVGGLDLEDTVLDLKDGDVEGTTAKIVDSDDAVGLLLKTIGQGSGGGLVDDTEDIEAGNLTSILGALTLSIVEVCGNSNNGVLDRLGQVGLGRLLHLVEDEATNLRGRVLLVTSRDPSIAVGVLDDFVGDLLDVSLDLSVAELATDQSLGGEESVLRVNHSLSLGGDTNQSLAVLGKSNY
ncbi:hypothetical protein Trco_003771 [Trichoderma cornu-damae]|uniref:Uncharacterized protein n=1 Tax=Trichoderma cornu-damae TaxID=654480 RepID=A0A9P8QQN0_9HYPO|nr:hypothetical protein Trco_003771 [Trichoderma cornu-damae]